MTSKAMRGGSPKFSWVLLLLVTLAMTAGDPACADGPPDSAQKEASELAATMASRVAKATIIARAKVVRVGDPPALCQRKPERCGDLRFVVRQWVTYDVEEVLYGELPAVQSVRVGHILEQLGGGTMEPGEWWLSESLFQPGKKLLLLLEKKGRGLQPTDVDHGAIPATPTNEAILRDLIQGTELSAAVNGDAGDKAIHRALPELPGRASDVR